MTCAETRLRARVKRTLGRTITIGRTANLTRPINGRSACHYCGPCERGCVTRSYFNSAFTTVPDAIATGKLHADHQRDGASGGDGRRPPARGRHPLRRSRDPRDARIAGPRRGAVCPGPRIGAHPPQFGDAPAAERPGQLERRAGPLSDGSPVGGRRRRGRISRPAADRRRLDRPVRPNALYVIRFRNTAAGPAARGSCADSASRAASAWPSTGGRRASAPNGCAPSRTASCRFA